MLFTILIIIAVIAAILLGLVILIQNPKGGGLSGSFGGAANQIFGVKRTTDDVERITWGLVIVVFVICLGAAAIKPSGAAEETNSATQAKRPSSGITNTPVDQGTEVPIEDGNGATQPETK